MKRVYVFGVGITLAMLSAGTWLGCSSDNSSTGDGGSDATGSSSGTSGSSSGSSSSSSGSGSSSGGDATTSSSSGSGDAGKEGGSSSSGSGSSGSSSGSSSSSSGSGGDAGDAGPTAPTWSQVYADIISGHCVGCHSVLPDGGARGGFSIGHLDMGTVDAGYANLVGVQPQGSASPLAPDAAVCNSLDSDAGSDSGILRVTPNDTAHSLICLKVHGYIVPPPCGAPMPPPQGGGPLPDDAGLSQDAAFQEIKAWILGGAKP